MGPEDQLKLKPSTYSLTALCCWGAGFQLYDIHAYAWAMSPDGPDRWTDFPAWPWAYLIITVLPVALSCPPIITYLLAVCNGKIPVWKSPALLVPLGIL